MRIKLIQIIIILLFFSLISIKPCFSKKKLTKSISKITKIIYHYYDSSVPPKFHRSYTITVTSDRVRIIVDSYGEIINDKEFEADSNQFEMIKKSLRINKIQKGKKIESKGCTGGTGEKIEYFENDNTLFSASVYHCGNKYYGDMKGNIDNVANDIKHLIPNFIELLKRDN